jgi:transmembrane sensor
VVAPHQPQILATVTSERSNVALADKSVVYLNADTRIAVTYSDHARLLMLSRGEAIFQVTKDNARPFRVVTDSATVTAVGTRFGVDRLGDAVEVRVFEGTVKVAGRNIDDRAVTRGQWLLLDPKRGISGGTFSPDAYPNWRTGWLEADRMPLAYVIARLNRYTNDKIQIADRSLVDVEINGRFRLDNTASTLKQISAAADVEVDKRDHDILLRRRHE